MNDHEDHASNVTEESHGTVRSFATRLACGLAVAMQCAGGAGQLPAQSGAANNARTAPYSVSSPSLPQTSPQTVDAPEEGLNEVHYHRWEDDGGLVVE
jgi:hypothetical protein